MSCGITEPVSSESLYMVNEPPDETLVSKDCNGEYPNGESHVTDSSAPYVQPPYSIHSSSILAL